MNIYASFLKEKTGNPTRQPPARSAFSIVLASEWPLPQICNGFGISYLYPFVKVSPFSIYLNFLLHDIMSDFLNLSFLNVAQDLASILLNISN